MDIEAKTNLQSLYLLYVIIPDNNIPDSFTSLTQRNKLQLKCAVLTDCGWVPVDSGNLPILYCNAQVGWRVRGRRDARLQGREVQDG